MYDFQNALTLFLLLLTTRCGRYGYEGKASESDQHLPTEGVDVGKRQLTMTERPSGVLIPAGDLDRVISFAAFR
jgi:hypothetical protein